jgi:ketosteroid isomerase-like protein
VGVSPEAQAILRAYEAYNAQDLAAGEAIMDPSIEWTQAGAGPNAGTFRGIPALRKHFEEGEMFAAFPDYTLQLDEYFEAGDRVVVIGTATGTGGETGLPFQMRLVHVWRMRDGKAIEVLEINGEPHIL